MGAVKEMYMDCVEAGVVPVEASNVGLWADRLGDRASILTGMPLRFRHNGRRGPVYIDVIPAIVAAMVVKALPDTNDELGWMLDEIAEKHL